MEIHMKNFQYYCEWFEIKNMFFMHHWIQYFDEKSLWLYSNDQCVSNDYLQLVDEQVPMNDNFFYKI